MTTPLPPLLPLPRCFIPNTRLPFEEAYTRGSFSAEQMQAYATAYGEAVAAALALKWLPISEAPKDGTFVLVADHDATPMVARFKHDNWWSTPTPSGRSIVWATASFWMPLLPTPPKGETP